MSRGIALSVVRAKLKAELRDASEANTYQDAVWNNLLINQQSDLCNAFRWDFLEQLWDLDCPPGSRYLTVPPTTIRGDTDAINFEHPVHVDRFFNRFYYEVESGITMELFNWRNSDLDARQDPIMRWQLVNNVNESSNANQVEIWPIPLTDQKLRFTAQRAPKVISGDTDTFDLDDLLLVYGVATSECALRDEKLAQVMSAKFDSRLKKLRAGYENAESFVLGRNQIEEYRRTRLISVRIGVA